MPGLNKQMSTLGPQPRVRYHRFGVEPGAIFILLLLKLSLQGQPWLSITALGNYTEMDKTGGLCPQSIFKLVEGEQEIMDNTQPFEFSRLSFPLVK